MIATDEALAFKAILQKVTTTADGGWRVTFDISMQDVERIARLAPHVEKLVDLVVIPEVGNG